MHLFPNETPLKLQQRDLSDNIQTQEEGEAAELKGGVTGPVGKREAMESLEGTGASAPVPLEVGVKAREGSI